MTGDPILFADLPAFAVPRRLFRGCGCLWGVLRDGVQVIVEPCEEHRPGWLGVRVSIERARLIRRLRSAG